MHRHQARHRSALSDAMGNAMRGGSAAACGSARTGLTLHDGDRVSGDRRQQRLAMRGNGQCFARGSQRCLLLLMVRPLLGDADRRRLSGRALRQNGRLLAS